MPAIELERSMAIAYEWFQFDAKPKISTYSSKICFFFN